MPRHFQVESLAGRQDKWCSIPSSRAFYKRSAFTTDDKLKTVARPAVGSQPALRIRENEGWSVQYIGGFVWEQLLTLN